MITSYDLAVSLRVYLEEKYNLTTVIRHKGWTIPEDKTFLTVYNPSTSLLSLAKNKELIDARIQLEIGMFSDSLMNLRDIYNQINKEIMYGTVPLLDLKTGEEIGAFSFEGIDMDSDFIADDTPIETEIYKHRRYVVATTKMAYIKN